jgi:hypothetical protein
MFRRAFVISTVLGVISAAAALAFAPELTRVGRAVSSHTPWRGRGFTPAPTSIDGAHRVASSLLNPVPDSLQGKFCRYPATGAAKAEPSIDSLSSLVADSESSALLSVEGQSRNPKLQSEAICTGVAPPRVP